MTLSFNFKNTLKNGSPTENWHSRREDVDLTQPDRVQRGTVVVWYRNFEFYRSGEFTDNNGDYQLLQKSFCPKVLVPLILTIFSE
jgi:hypothetical protein